MKIKVINPNTTLSMTRSIEHAARRFVGLDTQVWAVSPQLGPASIESFYDEYLSIPGVLEEIRRGDEEQCDAYVIACFGDPGLQAARELTAHPVVGIAEAACFVASTLAKRFSVVTVLHRSRAFIEETVVGYVPREKVVSVRTTGWPVLAFERDPEAGLAAIAEESRHAVNRDHAEAILLGCAGFVDFADELAEELQVPVLDGVAAATKYAELLVTMGQRTSKVGTYASPERKQFTGLLAPFGTA